MRFDAPRTSATTETATGSEAAAAKTASGVCIYLYAHADPVNGIDPTGFFTQAFGYLAEAAITADYEVDHLGHTILFGRVTKAAGRGYRLKPDILDLSRGGFAEIKPLSLNGIVTGPAQLAVYMLAFGSPPLSYKPITNWPQGPRTTVAGLVPIAYFNVGGVIYYTDVIDNLEDLTVLRTIPMLRTFINANSVRLSQGVASSLGRGLSLARLSASASNAFLQVRAGAQALFSTVSRGLI